jgi:hypothetical protein
MRANLSFRNYKKISWLYIMKILRNIFSWLCWILIIIGIATFFTGCCPKNIEKTNVKYDTTYIPRTVRDTIKIESSAKIIDVDTSKLINPYTAIIDSLFEVNNNLTVKLKASYSIKDNKFKFEAEQTKNDSTQVITKEVEKVLNKIEYVNRLEWWMYIVWAVTSLIFFLAGYFIGRFTK